MTTAPATAPHPEIEAQLRELGHAIRRIGAGRLLVDLANGSAPLQVAIQPEACEILGVSCQRLTAVAMYSQEPFPVGIMVLFLHDTSLHPLGRWAMHLDADGDRAITYETLLARPHTAANLARSLNEVRQAHNAFQKRLEDLTAESS